MKWDSPWGVGYPGWHIECSAMSAKYLGGQFDIHCGGIDHIPVHHTNEIAQTEGATGKKPWVKYWVHGEFLVVDDGKMSKSKGDFLTLSKLEKDGFKPIHYRFFILQSTYRKQLVFNYDNLENAKIAFEKLKQKIIDVKKNQNSNHHDNKENKIEQENIKKYKKQFLDAINDDLNTPKVLALINDIIKDENIDNKEKYELILEFDKVLGLDIENMQEEKVHVPKEVTLLAEERLKAKKEKNWKLADELREKIKEHGFIINDTKEGYSFTKK
jgi:cysteinyl-tRNA synthetase